jgi:FG-GAP-like repeat
LVANSTSSGCRRRRTAPGPRPTPGDVDGDGRADLVAVNDNDTWVMLSTGSEFSAPAQWSGEPFFGSKAAQRWPLQRPRR